MSRAAEDEVAFVPAHQKAGKARQRTEPAEGGGHAQQGIGLLAAVQGDEAARKIGEQGAENQGALPHDGRLAAEEIAQQEAVAVGEIAAVKQDAAVGKSQRQGYKPS